MEIFSHALMDGEASYEEILNHNDHNLYTTWNITALHQKEWDVVVETWDDVHLTRNLSSTDTWKKEEHQARNS